MAVCYYNEYRKQKKDRKKLDRIGDNIMAILKLKPQGKEYLWGGTRLLEEYEKEFDGKTLAETWELSCHSDGPSTIINGAHAGKTLPEYILEEGKEVLGSNCKRFEDFPILVKFIDAKQDLSIQVHPDDAYALKYENQYGKTEMWYVVDCDEDAYLYYGLKEEVSKEEFAQRIKENTVIEILNKVSIKPGDSFFIAAGTIHAIGKNTMIAEIQQNSNVTYRVYDFGRVGADGKCRELHVEKALEVTNLKPIEKDNSHAPHIAKCDYFVVDKLVLNAKEDEKQGEVTEESFLSILVIDGHGTVTTENEEVQFKKGDSLFLTAGTGKYIIKGEGKMLMTKVDEKKGKIKVGIDIGGTDIKIGLVNESNEIIKKASIPTLSKRGAEDLVKRIAQAVREILEEVGKTIEDCPSVGIGCPGTIDTKEGAVPYSNNLEWNNVPLAKLFEAELGIPAYVENDANCAALGEQISGAAKEYENVIMITLGTGLGSGIIVDGKILSGGFFGNGEAGHMIIKADGRLCTCGQKGCMEAYTSATGLIATATETALEKKDSLLYKMYQENESKMNGVIPFEALKQGDEAGAQVISEYIKNLGIGLISLINIFRPEVILFGGGVSNQGEFLLDLIREEIKGKSFASGKIPETQLKIATLKNDAGIVGAANIV